LRDGLHSGPTTESRTNDEERQRLLDAILDPAAQSTALATRDELFSANGRLVLAGFLAGHSGLTRDAYTLDLRQYVLVHRTPAGGVR
jgi:hypothetical protein